MYIFRDTLKIIFQNLEGVAYLKLTLLRSYNKCLLEFELKRILFVLVSRHYNFRTISDTNFGTPCILNTQKNFYNVDYNIIIKIW